MVVGIAFGTDSVSCIPNVPAGLLTMAGGIAMARMFSTPSRSRSPYFVAGRPALMLYSVGILSFCDSIQHPKILNSIGESVYGRG